MFCVQYWVSVFIAILSAAPFAAFFASTKQKHIPTWIQKHCYVYNHVPCSAFNIEWVSSLQFYPRRLSLLSLLSQNRNIFIPTWIKKHSYVCMYNVLRSTWYWAPSLQSYLCRLSLLSFAPFLAKQKHIYSNLNLKTLLCIQSSTLLHTARELIKQLQCSALNIERLPLKFYPRRVSLCFLCPWNRNIFIPTWTKKHSYVSEVY
jgi:hypothetical protein